MNLWENPSPWERHLLHLLFQETWLIIDLAHTKCNPLTAATIPCVHACEVALLGWLMFGSIPSQVMSKLNLCLKVGGLLVQGANTVTCKLIRITPAHIYE